MSKVKIMLKCICLMGITYPCNANAQVLRAGVIGAVQGIYKAELQGIRQKFRRQILNSKQNNFERNSFRKGSYNKMSQTSPQRNITFDDIYFSKPALQKMPDQGFSPSETELKSNGWERF